MIAGVAACGGEPKLDAAHLPAELMGLVPGVSAEADVVKAIAGATTERDQSLGGDKYVELSGEPAIAVRFPDDNFERTPEAWLVKLGGEHRLVSLRVPIKRTCAEIAKDFGDRATDGYCRFSNRKLEATEKQLCAKAPGGQDIWIECHDGKRLELWLEFKRSGSRSYRIAPVSAGRERDHE